MYSISEKSEKKNVSTAGKAAEAILELYPKESDKWVRKRAIAALTDVCETHPGPVLDAFGMAGVEKKCAARYANLAVQILKDGTRMERGSTPKDIDMEASRLIGEKIGIKIEKPIEFDPFLLRYPKFLKNEEVRELLKKSIGGNLREYVMSFPENIELKRQLESKGIKTALLEKGMRSGVAHITQKGDAVSLELLKDANKRVYTIMINALESNALDKTTRQNIYGKLGQFAGGKFREALNKYTKSGEMEMELSGKQMENII